MSADPYPAYLALVHRGELRRRAETALAALATCRVCPRACGAERLRDAPGACRIGRWARVASYGPHFGEEDCLRGSHGSGTIFFSGCNLGCVFCQNWDISHECAGPVVSAERLAGMMLEMQAAGCHNINWVTPTHVLPQALEALALAAEEGLRLPIVYNSSGYDSVEQLRWLEGVVDLYLPDFKFWDASVAARLAQAEDYPGVARAALGEMHRQVGVLTLNQEGIAQRGVLVRHLVMPNNLAGTREIAQWLSAELSPDTYVNVMAQYHPAGAVTNGREIRSGRAYRDLSQPVAADEYEAALGEARAAGLRRFDQRRGGWR